MTTAVLLAQLFAAPLLLLGLGLTALGRDRIPALAALVVSAAQAGLLGWAILDPQPSEFATAFLLLSLATASALVLRLGRDRRARHIRSTAESLLVLGLGAILLALLLSLPSVLAQLGRAAVPL